MQITTIPGMQTVAKQRSKTATRSQQSFASAMSSLTQPRMDSITFRSNGTVVSSLATKDLKYLGEMYNPKQMDQEQYDSFLERLVHEGVLSEEDLPYAGYKGVGIVPERRCGIFYDGVEVLATSLHDASGNVMHFAHCMVSQVADPPDRVVDRKVEVFKKISHVLSQMQGIV